MEKRNNFVNSKLSVLEYITEEIFTTIRWIKMRYLHYKSEHIIKLMITKLNIILEKKHKKKKIYFRTVFN